MKNKTIYLFAAGLLIISTLAWLYEKNEGVASSTDPVLIPFKQALFNLQQEKNFKSFSKEKKLEKTYAILEKLPPEYKTLKRQYQIALSTLPDITFHGRVIDQYGQPVVNAEIYFAGTNTYLSAGSGRGYVYTDQQGNFEINAEGAELLITGIKHKEVMSHNLTRFLSQDDTRGRDQNWRKHSDMDHAYLFNVWRLGEYEGAISGNINGDYDGDGKLYTLLLDQSNYENRRNDGMTKGHIYISCTRPHMEGNRDYGDWHVSITPINGGIQESNDIYMNIAPEAGYRPSLNITMQKGSQSYIHELINKHYYFASNNGNEYGSIRLTVRPFWNQEKEACKIDINYKINPTGSRNLELKRDNTSQPKLPSPQSLASN